MMKKRVWGAFVAGVVLLTLGIVPVLTQPTCPADILLAHARAGGICRDVGQGEVCYGNGMVASPLRDADSSFTQPGDRVGAAAVEALRLSSADEWSVAALRLQTSIADLTRRSVLALVFGDVEIENLVSALPEVLLVARGTANVRATPEEGSDLLTSVGFRGELVANGRLVDGHWLRVFVPEADALGWVASDIVTPQSSLDSLTIVSPDDAFYRPFQRMTLQTGRDDARCAGAPESGLLLQTPDPVDENLLVINGVTLQLAGTAYFQADDVLTIDVLDGYALVDEQFVPAGTHLSVQLEPAVQVGSPVPFAADSVAALPIDLLEYRFRLPAPLTAEEIDAQTVAFFAPPTTTPDSAPVCLRLSVRDVDLRSGPGENYPVSYRIGAGRRLYPVTQTTEADGTTWWQVYGGHWIRASLVESSSTCPELPVTGQAFITAPSTNTLLLETCTTTHGPLLAGQHVTIEFVPRGWASLADALDAPRRSSGAITIGEEWLYVMISDPIQIASDRWVRVFSADWVAEAGTYRIAGKRLTYELICNMTVPVSS